MPDSIEEAVDGHIPYQIGSDKLPGLSKLIEECGEVLQVAGKFMGTGGQPWHWDGSNLNTRMIEELGDLLGAIAFFIEVNEISWEKVQARADHKAELFATWHVEVQDV